MRCSKYDNVDRYEVKKEVVGVDRYYKELNDKRLREDYSYGVCEWIMISSEKHDFKTEVI